MFYVRAFKNNLLIEKKWRRTAASELYDTIDIPQQIQL